MAVQCDLKYNKSQDLLKMYEDFMIFWDSFMFFYDFGKFKDQNC